MRQRTERPKILKGSTFQKEVGCGTLNVIINHSNGTPLEVFISLGKAGGCSYCQNGALGRAISIGLQCGIPIKEYLQTLEGSRCPSPIWEDNVVHLSCPDAVARIFKDWMNENHT